jgi:hypothetical protein
MTDGSTSKRKEVIARNPIDWNLNYAALLAYRAEHGHCNIPQKHTYECILPGKGENGQDYHYKGNLGKWADNQRQFKKAGKLPPDRDELLQQLCDEGSILLFYQYYDYYSFFLFLYHLCSVDASSCVSHRCMGVASSGSVNGTPGGRVEQNLCSTGGVWTPAW